MIRIFGLLQRLIDANLRFMVVGGMASILHGATTTTQDLDISLSMDPSELEKLREALKDLNPVHRMTPQELSFLTHPESFSGFRNLYLRTDWGVLDIIGDLSLIGNFDELYSRAEEVTSKGHPIKVLALKDLIDLKTKLGRDKDLLAVNELVMLLKDREKMGS